MFIRVVNYEIKPGMMEEAETRAYGGATLVPMERQGIEIDHCPTCRGDRPPDPRRCRRAGDEPRPRARRRGRLDRAARHGLDRAARGREARTGEHVACP